MFKQLFFLFFLSISLSQQIQAEIENHPSLHYHTLPVYGNASLGYYYVKLYIGGPQYQQQSVIIDTGSGILAVPCTKCQKCSKKHIDPPYDPQKSSQSLYLTCKSDNQYCKRQCKTRDEEDSCPFSIFYAEGSSLQGVMVEDNIKFQNYSKGEEIRTYFGCTTKQTNLFLTQEANGIFGLAPKRQSDLFDKMIAKHSQYTGEILQFSLCLSSNGGIMTIGSINSQIHKENEEETVVSSFTDSKNLYSLTTVTEIRIGKEILHWGKNYGVYGIFIDSGSTFTYFPREVYKKFENNLKKICEESQRCKLLSGQETPCYKLETGEKALIQYANELFPSFYFQISGKDIPWPANKYMLTRNLKNREVCLGVLGLDRFLLGANWMYDRDIVFNIKQKKVSIYDNIKCQENAPIMGSYNKSKQQPLGTKTILTKTDLSEILFIMGIIFLGIAIFVFILMMAFRLCEEKVSIQEKKGENNASQEASLMREHSEQVINSTKPTQQQQ